MLMSQNGGRGENGNLFPGFNSLEGRPHGDFGFTESGVAAYQAIHGVGFLHIGFNFFNRLELIRSLFKNK